MLALLPHLWWRTFARFVQSSAWIPPLIGIWPSPLHVTTAPMMRPAQRRFTHGANDDGCRVMHICAIGSYTCTPSYMLLWQQAAHKHTDITSHASLFAHTLCVCFFL